MVKVDPDVIVKLVVFSVVLFILPVGVLQASLHGYFDGKTYPAQSTRKEVKLKRNEKVHL